jgi:hypothetical protein
VIGLSVAEIERVVSELGIQVKTDPLSGKQFGMDLRGGRAADRSEAEPALAAV